MKNSLRKLGLSLLLTLAAASNPRAAVIVQDPGNIAGAGEKTWSYLVVEGEDYDSETNDGEGVGFTRVDNSGAITTPSGSQVLAPNTTASKKAALFTQTAFARHIDKVTYKVQFATPGKYYLYMRFTMFENSENGTYLNEDSFFLPPGFNKDPQNDWPLMDANGQNGGYVEGCCSAAGFLHIWEGENRVDRAPGDEVGRAYWEGNFHWNELMSSQFINPETQGEPLVRFEYEVTPDMVGKPQDFTISYREGGLAIDLFLFSTSPDLMHEYSQAQLDQIILGMKVSVQDPSDVVGTGVDAWSYLIVEGEDYASEMNEEEGVGFTRVDSTGAITTLSGSQVLAPDTTASQKGALFTQTPFGRHVDKVTYKVQFATPGTYYLYMRFTMFENSENGTYLNEDSFFVPPAFNKDPQNDWPLMDGSGQNGGYVEGCCSAAGFLHIWEGDTKVDRAPGDEVGREYWEGNFHWNELISSQFLNAETQGEPTVRFQYEVTPEMVGQPLDFTISYREGGLTIDLFLFSTNPDLMHAYTQEQLDQVLLGTTTENRPQLSIRRSGKDITLAWPVSATGFALESNNGVGSQGWTPVATTATVNGNENTVTVDASTGTRFYRLKKP